MLWSFSNVALANLTISLNSSFEIFSGTFFCSNRVSPQSPRQEITLTLSGFAPCYRRCADLLLALFLFFLHFLLPHDLASIYPVSLELLQRSHPHLYEVSPVLVLVPLLQVSGLQTLSPELHSLLLSRPSRTDRTTLWNSMEDRNLPWSRIPESACQSCCL